MAKLWEVTKLVRSKNAGPFVLTFDIMFDDPATYRLVQDSGVITRELVARMSRHKEAAVLFFYCDTSQAIKSRIPRPVTSGDLADSDVFGGQQYAPLLDIDVPDKGASQ